MNKKTFSLSLLASLLLILNSGCSAILGAGVAPSLGEAQKTPAKTPAKDSATPDGDGAEAETAVIGLQQQRRTPTPSPTPKVTLAPTRGTDDDEGGGETLADLLVGEYPDPEDMDGVCPDLLPMNRLIGDRFVWVLYRGQRPMDIKVTVRIASESVDGVSVYATKVTQVEGRVNRRMRASLEQVFGVKYVCHKRVAFQYQDGEVFPLIGNYDTIKQIVEEFGDGEVLELDNCTIEMTNFRSVNNIPRDESVKVSCKQGDGQDTALYFQKFIGLVRIESSGVLIDNQQMIPR